MTRAKTSHSCRRCRGESGEPRPSPDDITIGFPALDAPVIDDRFPFGKEKGIREPWMEVAATFSEAPFDLLGIGDPDIEAASFELGDGVAVEVHHLDPRPRFGDRPSSLSMPSDRREARVFEKVVSSSRPPVDRRAR